MNDDKNEVDTNQKKSVKASNGRASNLNDIDALSQYLKSEAGAREGRAIPPLEKWHPEHVADMDFVIKANGEWWHEGGKMTRESLVSLFATILWKEESNGVTEYFLKTPMQKIRIQVEDAPLLVNDVGIVEEEGNRWLEFTTTTGDVVRLDDAHRVILKAYNPKESHHTADDGISANTKNDLKEVDQSQVRPYILVRNGLMALIGRNTFYHLAEIGELTEKDGETILTLQSGGQYYPLSMPTN